MVRKDSKNIQIGNSVDSETFQNENVQRLLIIQITCSMEQFIHAAMKDVECRQQEEIPASSGRSGTVHLYNLGAVRRCLLSCTTAFLSL